MTANFERLALPLPDGPWGFPLTFANGTDDIIVAVSGSYRTMKRFSVPDLAELESFTLPVGSIANVTSCSTLASDGAGRIWYILYDPFFFYGTILCRRDADGTVTELRTFPGSSGNWTFGTNVVWNPTDSLLYAVRRVDAALSQAEVHQIDPETGSSTQVSSGSGSFADPPCAASDNALWFASYGSYPALHRYDIAAGTTATLASAGYAQNLLPMPDGTILFTYNADPNLQQASFDGSTITEAAYAETPAGFQNYDPPDDASNRTFARTTTSLDWTMQAFTTSPGNIFEVWTVEHVAALDVPTLALPELAIPFRSLASQPVAKELG